MPQENYPRIDSLTSIRLFCTLLVVIHHLNLGLYTNNSFIVFLDKYILHTGRGIVSFFFILSGFVICYASQNWSGWKSYLIKRLSRVFPNHWIVSLTIAGFTFVLPLVAGENFFHYIAKAVLNLTLLQSFIPDRSINFCFNGVTWTLSVEWFFYLSFIFLRKQSTKSLWILFLSLCGAKLLLETVWVIFSIKPFAHWLFFVFPIFRLPEFLLGILLCRSYFKNPAAFSKFKMNPLIVMLASILTIAMCRYYFSPYAIYLYSTLPAIFSVLMLLCCLGNGSSARRFLNNKILVFLGEASFSIYLIHQPIFNGARRLFQKWGLTMTVSMMLALMAFSLLVAFLYFFFIERKVYQLSVKFLNKKPAPILA